MAELHWGRRWWPRPSVDGRLIRCQVSVFPAAASLQTGSSTGFGTDGGFSVQVSASMFLFPDTRHLTPETLRFDASDFNVIIMNNPQCTSFGMNAAQ